MRIAKAATLIFMLVFALIALDVRSTQRAQAADSLEGSDWANDDDMFALYFRKGGLVYLDDMGEDDRIKGTYGRAAASVEMIFQNGTRASASIKGNKMSVRFTYRSGKTDDTVLTQE